MKPMGGRTWKYWPASGPVFFTVLQIITRGITSITLGITRITIGVTSITSITLGITCYKYFKYYTGITIITKY